MPEAAADRTPGIHRYHDARLLLDVVILLPGHLYVTTDLEYISTVLGTCVGVCLYDTARCFGGMNHFLLPEARRRKPGEGTSSHRYGTNAMADLLAAMDARGSDRRNLRAKVFGGARVNGDQHGIGRQNRDFAIRFLRDQQIEVLLEHTGGNLARQVLFDPRCGHARVRTAGTRALPDGARQEAAFIRRALAPDTLRENQPLQLTRGNGREGPA